MSRPEEGNLKIWYGSLVHWFISTTVQQFNGSTGDADKWKWGNADK